MTGHSTINLRSTLVRRDDLLESEIDGEVVLLDLTTEKYFHMDATGARIWQLLDPPRRLSELLDQLQAEFEVDRATCEADVLEFAQRLLDARLVQSAQA